MSEGCAQALLDGQGVHPGGFERRLRLLAPRVGLGAFGADVMVDAVLLHHEVGRDEFDHLAHRDLVFGHFRAAFAACRAVSGEYVLVHLAGQAVGDDAAGLAPLLFLSGRRRGRAERLRFECRLGFRIPREQGLRGVEDGQAGLVGDDLLRLGAEALRAGDEDSLGKQGYLVVQGLHLQGVPAPFRLHLGRMGGVDALDLRFVGAGEGFRLGVGLGQHGRQQARSARPS